MNVYDFLKYRSDLGVIQSLRAFRRAGKMEEGRRKKEEGSGSRDCQVTPRRHQGGSEETQGIYIDSNAPHIKDRNLNM